MTHVSLRDPSTTLGAKVIGDGRLSVSSRTSTAGQIETFKGHGFNINPGDINLTSDSESGLLYILNTGANPLVIDLFVFILGTSTGGTGTALLQIYRNPTAGTLISGATPANTAAANRDFSSGRLFSSIATAYVGVEGSTITASDGETVQSRASCPNRVPLEVGSVVLKTNNSIAMSITPPPSNTGLLVQVAMQVLEETEGLIDT